MAPFALGRRIVPIWGMELLLCSSCRWDDNAPSMQGVPSVGSAEMETDKKPKQSGQSERSLKGPKQGTQGSLGPKSYPHRLLHAPRNERQMIPLPSRLPQPADGGSHG